MKTLRRNRALHRPLAGLIMATLAVGVVPFVGGCGGNSGGNNSSAGTFAPTNPTGTTGATGRAVVTVLWPAPSSVGTAPATTRLIPAVTNLVHLDVLRTVDGVTTIVGSGEASRPAGGTSSTIEVDNLPIDTLTVVAKAYPGMDPANLGTPVAQGSMPVTTRDGEVVAFSLTLNSTIDHLSLAPANPTIALTTQQAITATAWDGPDETTASLVLLSPEQLQWTSSDTALATVSPTGVVTAIAGGKPVITVKDAESDKSVVTTATIPLVVTISPATPTLSVTDATTLTATVAGTTNQAVTWSVAETGGGTISASGVYKAPALPGRYSITATSRADSTYSATVTVTVQASTVIGTIR